MGDDDDPPKSTELPKRLKRNNSNSEDDPNPISTTDTREELSPHGHRHVLKSNIINSAIDKNQKQIAQMEERPIRARDPRPENPPRKDESSDNEGNNNPEGSQEGSQED